MGAHLAGLERTRSGHFRIDHALTLDELQNMTTAGNVAQALMSIDDALLTFPSIPISEAETVRVLHGNQISCPASLADISSDLVRLHSPAGTLLALARINAGILKPDLVFS